MSTRSPRRKIFVSGSVHLDIVSKITDHPETTDKIGSLTIEVGGTAYNIAMNLLSLGVEGVFFYTALKRSPVSSLLTEAISETTPLIEFSDSLPQSGFNAHLLDGELVSAVSSIAIENHIFEPSAEVRDALSQSSFAILDCNHHPDSLNMLAGICVEEGVPFALCAVSQGKALKIPQITVAPAGVFLNAEEWRYIQKHHPDWRPGEKTLFFVTDGPRGARVFADEKLRARVAAPTVLERDHFLGAGDAFCAGVIHALYLQGATIDQALEYGSAVAAKIICRPNCSAGAADLLDKHLAGLRGQAERDHLTGLHLRGPGKRFVEDLFARARFGQESFSVLFLDLDHFKQVNDAVGHAAGDAVLRAAARLIQETLRDGDMAVRWGGEEFVAILPNCALPSAVGVAERILKKLRTTVLPEIGRPVTASIGVAVSRGEDETTDSLLARGDAMLYQAKAGGRDRVAGENEAKKTHTIAR